MGRETGQADLTCGIRMEPQVGGPKRSVQSELRHEGGRVGKKRGQLDGKHSCGWRQSVVAYLSQLASNSGSHVYA